LPLTPACRKAGRKNEFELLKKYFTFALGQTEVLKIPRLRQALLVTSNAMRTTLNILTGLILLLTSCNNSTTEERKNYIESEPTFFKLRNEDWLTNKWIRKPENLLTIHETFKKVGYNNIIGSILSDNPVIVQDIYINKKGYNLIDSLVLTYKERDKGTKYYKEFWARRESEKNDSAVFVILKDIQYSYKTKMTSGVLQLQADNSKLNDTLKTLLEIEYRNNTLTTDLAMKDFTTLRLLGFHQSAYNLLFESYKYQDIKWNKDSLVKTLKQTDKFIYPWFQDDTK
jgi:hypothetical protein